MTLFANKKSITSNLTPTEGSLSLLVLVWIDPPHYISILYFNRDVFPAFVCWSVGGVRGRRGVYSGGQAVGIQARSWKAKQWVDSFCGTTWSSEGDSMRKSMQTNNQFRK